MNIGQEEYSAMRILARYENLPFKKKLFFVFGISFMLCITIAVAMLTDYCTQILVRTNIDNLNVISRQASIDFNRSRRDIEKQLFNTITMFQIPESIATCNDDRNPYKERELQYKLNQVVAENTYFDYAYVVTDGDYSCDTLDKIYYQKDNIRPHIQKALDDFKNLSMKKGYVWFSDNENHIYLIHSIRKINNLDHVGYIVARIKGKAVDMIEDTGVELVFFDKDKRCIFVKPDHSELEKIVYNGVLDGSIKEGYQKLANEAYYVTERSNNDGWTVLGIASINNIYSMRSQIQMAALILIILALSCGYMLMNHLTRKVSKQVDAISDAIIEMTKGEIGTQATVYMNDDIGKIAKHFNEMSVQNKHLIEDLVRTEAQKNTACMEAIDYKYRFLHTQINPHFIYNTLETINAIAKVNHTPEVSHIVQLVGKYFRNITKYSDLQFITISKEFELLECFIDIYKTIRGSNISFTIKYPEELRNIEIPTMLLQPIVENSFIHGICGMDKMFVINLGVKPVRNKEGKLCEVILFVTDNGVGMDEKAIERLKKGKLDDTNAEKKSKQEIFRNIGIPNIIERLRMLYGEKAKLDIESDENGTTTTIRFPVCFHGIDPIGNSLK